MKKYIYLLGILVFSSALQQCESSKEGHSAGQNGEKVQASNTSTNTMTTVEVMKPSLRAISSEIAMTGTIKPDKKVTLLAMEQGFLKSISVDIGDTVKKGQAIATLSNPMLTYELKAAEVKVKEAQAKLKGAQAKQLLTKADASIKQKTYTRLQKIYEVSKGLTTITELEIAQRDAEIAAAQQSVDIAYLDTHRAEIDAAESMVAAIQERQGMLTIRAPFSGSITGRFIDPGAMVQSALSNNNAMPIVSIESSSPARLSLPIPESDIAGIKVGDPVTIEFPSIGGPAIQAKISRIAQNLDPSSKTMELQVDLLNKEGNIRSGMYAKATISRSSSTDILSLPHAAVLMKKDAAYVLTVKEGIVEEVLVNKGLSSKDFFEVRNNTINKNTQIIVKGKSMVSNGQKVNAVIK